MVTLEQILCAIRYWPLVPDKPCKQSLPLLYTEFLRFFDMLLPTPLNEIISITYPHLIHPLSTLILHTSDYRKIP